MPSLSVQPLGKGPISMICDSGKVPSGLKRRGGGVRTSNIAIKAPCGHCGQLMRRPTGHSRPWPNRTCRSKWSRRTISSLVASSPIITADSSESESKFSTVRFLPAFTTLDVVLRVITNGHSSARWRESFRSTWKARRLTPRHPRIARRSWLQDLERITSTCVPTAVTVQKLSPPIETRPFRRSGIHGPTGITIVALKGAPSCRLHSGRIESRISARLKCGEAARPGTAVRTLRMTVSCSWARPLPPAALSRWIPSSGISLNLTSRN